MADGLLLDMENQNSKQADNIKRLGIVYVLVEKKEMYLKQT